MLFKLQEEPETPLEETPEGEESSEPETEPEPIV